MPGMQEKLRAWSYHLQRLGKAGTRIETVLRDVIGVYSSHPSGPLSLYARLDSFSEQMFYDLDEQRLAFRVPAMRLSAYFLPRETAPLVVAATFPPPSDPFWEKRYSQKNRNMPEHEFEVWKREILQFAREPVTAAKVKQATSVPDEITKIVLNRMAFEGHLLRVGAKSLRSNIISYVVTRVWADEPFFQRDPQQALIWLAGEYLRAFGPARVKDFQWWAGVSLTKAKAAISAVETVSIGDDYLLRSQDLNEFDSFNPPLKDRIDLLPQWDCYTMGYAPDGRQRFVTPDMQDQIYGSLGATGGNALGTVLVNGLAYGSWQSRFKGTSMIVDLNLFESPSPRLLKDIETQFMQMVSLLGAKRLLLGKNSSVTL
ncbi:winged helix DNA-binding domain-containing protein [bacterium]|nr:winged helix DNA-binding domain-containing protein [bacterium]